MRAIRAGWIAACAVAAMAGVSFYGTLRAQQIPGVKRTVLLKQDMAIPGKEAVMVRGELPPGATEGRHKHPAEAFVFVEQGTFSFFIEGKGTATYKAGDAFTVPRDTVHEGTNKGTETVVQHVVFIADKGKPLTTQVP